MFVFTFMILFSRNGDTYQTSTVPSLLLYFPQQRHRGTLYIRNYYCIFIEINHLQNNYEIFFMTHCDQITKRNIISNPDVKSNLNFLRKQLLLYLNDNIYDNNCVTLLLIQRKHLIITTPEVNAKH